MVTERTRTASLGPDGEAAPLLHAAPALRAAGAVRFAQALLWAPHESDAREAGTVPPKSEMRGGASGLQAALLPTGLHSASARGQVDGRPRGHLVWRDGEGSSEQGGDALGGRMSSGELVGLPGGVRELAVAELAREADEG